MLQFVVVDLIGDSCLRVLQPQAGFTYDIDYQNLRSLTGQDVRNLGYTYEGLLLDSSTPYGSETLHKSGDSSYSGAQESFNTARHSGNDYGDASQRKAWRPVCR